MYEVVMTDGSRQRLETWVVRGWLEQTMSDPDLVAILRRVAWFIPQHDDMRPFENPRRVW